MSVKQSTRLLFTAFSILMCSMSAFARGREGYTVKPTSRDSGNIIEATTITIGTTTPVQIFYSTATQSINYREIMFENSSTNTYRVYIGTFSGVDGSTTGTTGRFFIPAGGSWTTNAKDDLWGLFEPSAFGTGTLQLYGEFERDVLDENITNR